MMLFKGSWNSCDHHGPPPHHPNHQHDHRENEGGLLFKDQLVVEGGSGYYDDIHHPHHQHDHHHRQSDRGLYNANQITGNGVPQRPAGRGRIVMIVVLIIIIILITSMIITKVIADCIMPTK